MPKKDPQKYFLPHEMRRIADQLFMLSDRCVGAGNVEQSLTCMREARMLAELAVKASAIGAGHAGLPSALKTIVTTMTNRARLAPALARQSAITAVAMRVNGNGQGHTEATIEPEPEAEEDTDADSQ